MYTNTQCYVIYSYRVNRIPLHTARDTRTNVIWVSSQVLARLFAGLSDNDVVWDDELKSSWVTAATLKTAGLKGRPGPRAICESWARRAPLAAANAGANAAPAGSRASPLQPLCRQHLCLLLRRTPPESSTLLHDVSAVKSAVERLQPR